MYEDDESEDDELSEQTFEDEYEDAEGENLAPSTSEVGESPTYSTSCGAQPIRDVS